MESPLTIVHVGAFPFPTGHGSQVYVRGLATALGRRGHTVLVVCYAGSTSGVPKGVTVARGPRVPGVRFVRSGPHWSKVIADIGLVSTLRRQLSRRHVDVVHAHNVEAPLLARIAGARPLVHSLHTRMEQELPQWYPRWPGAGGLGSLADRAVTRICDANVAISHAAEAHLRKLNAKEVHLIPPGVDMADLANADGARFRKLTGSLRPLVVYTGNTDPYQDLPLLLRAMVDVPEADLAIVTQDAIEPLHLLADQLRLPIERRKFVQGGFDVAKDALAAGSLGVIPRRVCTGFPMKLLNQLGMGLPTVIADGSWQPVTGALRAKGPLVEVIREQLADPERLRERGQAAIADVAQNWTWDVRAEQLERLYRRLIA